MKPIVRLVPLVIIAAMVSTAGCVVVSNQLDEAPASDDAREPAPMSDVVIDGVAVELDPDRPLDPKSDEIHLLVTGVACNSGRPLEDDEIVLLSRVEEEHAVQLVIGSVPSDGAQTCPSNPPTPYRVQLREPLRARGVYVATIGDLSELRETDYSDNPVG